MKPDTKTPAAAPTFDEKVAQACAPVRHEATARTVAFRQPDGERVHLFSATRQFIATEKLRPAAR
ncbi:MAG: hypothetical protein HZA93_23860 [Verrucomicrobia bacterium]|nr:hypothetical protein [Verrucomicrobiota bacterium]